MPPEPKTESQLFDFLNEAHGVGNYDDVVGDKPWFKVRMSEIGKLKTIMRARRVSVREVYMASEYCTAHGIPITASHELFAHIPAAMQEWRRQVIRRRTEGAATDVQEVAAAAFEAGQHDFVERLLRAAPDSQKAMIVWWKRAERPWNRPDRG